MGTFHRWDQPGYVDIDGSTLTVPVQPGSLSIGGGSYEFINIGAIGAGGSPADVKKVGGNYDDTHFIDFGEDGQAFHGNRAHVALAINTDTIDDILRESIPTIVSISSIGPDTDIPLTGEVFVGRSGDPLIVTTSLAYVRDDFGGLVYSSGTGVVVTLIHDGGGGDVRGTTADGFYTDPTVRVAPGIPAGTIWRLFYGIRSNTARQTEDLKSQHLTPFLSTFWSLNPSGRLWTLGLDDFYRRNSSVPGGTSGTALAVSPDTPGDGATIIRDGQALTVRGIGGDWVATVQPDPHLANFLADLSQPSAVFAQLDHRSGDIGFAFLTSLRFSAGDIGEQSNVSRPYAGFAVFNPRHVVQDLVESSATYTRISNGASGVLNPTVGGGVDRVKVDSPNYFYNISGDTAIQLGLDILVITRASGTQAYRIMAFQGQDLVDVETLGGATPNFTTVDEVVTMTWESLSFVTGGSTPGTNGVPIFGCYRPAKLSASLTGLDEHWAPEFIAHRTGGGSFGNQCLRWGYLNEANGVRQALSFLHSDGGIVTRTGSFYGILEDRSYNDTGSGSGGTTTLYVSPSSAASTGPGASFSNLQIKIDGTINDLHTIDVNVGTITKGQNITIIVYNETGMTLTMDWDAGKFVFSGDDDVGPRRAGETYKWTGIVSDVDGTAKYYMTRTDYE